MKTAHPSQLPITKVRVLYLDEWAAIEETLYLNSIPGMAESIIEGGAEPLSDCIDEDSLEW